MPGPPVPRPVPPIAFAHRGGRAHRPENTLPAFENALALGANGVESDVWLTADGVPVLHHDIGVRVRGSRRRVPITTVPRAELPADVPTLAELYDLVGDRVEVSLDVKDPAAARPTVEVAVAAGAVCRLWLCGAVGSAIAWRALHPEVRLVDSSRRHELREGLAGRARRLRAAGVDALNMRWWEWGGRAGVRAAHDAGILAFGWHAHHLRDVRTAAALDLDGVFGDDVTALVKVLLPGS